MGFIVQSISKRAGEPPYRMTKATKKAALDAAIGFLAQGMKDVTITDEKARFTAQAAQNFGLSFCVLLVSVERVLDGTPILCRIAFRHLSLPRTLVQDGGSLRWRRKCCNESGQEK
jgi:hypothetical protein